DEVLWRFLSLDRGRAKACDHEHEHRRGEAGTRTHQDTLWNRGDPGLPHVVLASCLIGAEARILGTRPREVNGEEWGLRRIYRHPPSLPTSATPTPARTATA